MRKKRHLRRNILLVCEGQSTEYHYFSALRKIALEAEIWDVIDIHPKPITEEETLSEKKPIKRKNRKLNDRPVGEADEIELTYNWSATPARFVKEARDRMKGDTYVEAWAIFDKDGHPAHQDAFNLAAEPIEGKQVNIAFSSISIETWILLHFELNLTAFAKPSCKKGAKKYITCGKKDNKEDGDCEGKLCVAGYLRKNGYAEKYTKKVKEAEEFLSDLAVDIKRDIAMKNASRLRWEQTKGSASIERSIYDLNPFTNVDVLVRRLTGEVETFEWCEFGSMYKLDQMEITVTASDSRLLLCIVNKNNMPRVVSEHDISICIIRGNESKQWFPKKGEHILVFNQAKIFELPLAETLEIRTTSKCVCFVHGR